MLVICSYCLAHHISRHWGSVHADLAGRGLDEVRTGFHCQERGFRDCPRSYEQTCLEYHLQHDFLAHCLSLGVYRFSHCTNFLRCPALISRQEGIESQDYVNLVSARLDCQFAFPNLDFKEALG